MMHAQIVRITGSTALMLSLLLLSNSEAEAAPSVTGQTYGDASSALSKAGLTAIVAVRVGDQLAKGKCLVVSQRNESVAQDGSHSTAGKKVALAVNCESSQATATKPGFSAASPEGRAADAAAAKAKAKQAQ